jgi:hypothetical protein
MNAQKGNIINAMVRKTRIMKKVVKTKSDESAKI